MACAMDHSYWDAGWIGECNWCEQIVGVQGDTVALVGADEVVSWVVFL